MWIYVPSWLPWLVAMFAAPLLVLVLWQIGRLLLHFVGLLIATAYCAWALLSPCTAERFGNWRRRQDGFIPYPGDPRYNPATDARQGHA